MRYMRENGFDVIMVSSNGKEWPDLIKNEGCDYRIVHMTRKMSPFTDLKSLFRLYKLFKKEKPDIVHSHTPKAGLLAMLASKLAGVKIRIHTIAGLRFMTATGTTRKILIYMEKLTGKAAHYVWPNSYSLLNYIKENRLVSDHKLQVIGHGSSNGVNLNRFSASSLKQEKLCQIKKDINYDETCFYILSMGRIVKDKGIEELVRSFTAVYQTNSKLHLMLLGSFEDDLDPVSKEIKQIIKTHSAITHIDWTDDVEYFMHISHLLVHASYREGFPNTLLQAGAMNCPIVCSSIEGNIDIVTNNETGLLFKPGDAGELLEKLKYAISHINEMKNYAGNLRNKIEKYFSQEYLHQCLKEKYLELLGQN